MFFLRFKNGKPLEQTPKLRVQGKEGFYLVTISKAEVSHSGIYRFVAINSFNTLESQAKVDIFNVENVEVKPTFTRITGEIAINIQIYQLNYSNKFPQIIIVRRLMT